MGVPTPPAPRPVDAHHLTLEAKGVQALGVRAARAVAGEVKRRDLERERRVLVRHRGGVVPGFRGGGETVGDRHLELGEELAEWLAGVGGSAGRPVAVGHGGSGCNARRWG